MLNSWKRDSSCDECWERSAGAFSVHHRGKRDLTALELLTFCSKTLVELEVQEQCKFDTRCSSPEATKTELVLQKWCSDEFQTLILKLFLFFCVLTVMLSLLAFLSSQLLILLWNRKRQVGYFIELACLSALLVWAETPSTELLTVILSWRKLKRVTACLICQFCRQQHSEHLYHQSWANFHWLYYVYQNKTEIWCLWYSRERPQALCGQALCSLTFYWARMCTSIHKLD